MNKKYLIANWKSNMTIDKLENYFSNLNNIELKNLNIAFAVPSIFIHLAKQKTNLNIIAQDVEYFDYGSHTGRISYQHLLDFNINTSIIGHSEQRVFNDNTDEIINQKIIKLTNNNINVILCIGEPKEIYDKKQTKDFILNQLAMDLKNVEINKDKIIISYEPVWSIGTGVVPSNEYIEEIINCIKSKYDLDVLYGGSVNKNNINELKNINNLNGFLIGSGSINPNDFIDMIKKYN